MKMGSKFQDFLHDEDAGGLKQFCMKRGSKNSCQGRLIDLFRGFLVQKCSKQVWDASFKFVQRKVKTSLICLV